jgi:hypothetical protein
VRESTKTTDRDAAQRILDDKRGRIARGEVVLPRTEKVTYDDAKRDLRAYYETHKARDVAEGRPGALGVGIGFDSRTS